MNINNISSLLVLTAANLIILHFYCNIEYLLDRSPQDTSIPGP